MQNLSSSLHSQLQHSTAVLDGFISDVQILKKESSALSKSVRSLARDYSRQCKRLGTSASTANPVIQNLEKLQACSSLVYDKADDLKGCLDALVKNSYKPDLKRADQGKRTKKLVQAEQEAATFETHIRLAESLVATVLPKSEAPACHNALRHEDQQLGDLDSAYLAVQGSYPTGIQTPLLGQLQIDTLKAAATRLRDQIEAPSVRQRVQPMPMGQ